MHNNYLFTTKRVDMKFKNYLTEIDNVEIFPIISLIIFITVFIFAAIYTFTKDKNVMNDNADIPLK